MTDEQCLHYVKTFYYPDEAAAAWCGISEEEYSNIKTSIKRVNDSDVLTQASNSNTFNESLGYGLFPLIPDKPCFKKRIEQICYAIEGDLILCTRDGRPEKIEVGYTNQGIARPRRAFTAIELKKWMEESHPNERPAFLFNQLERKELADREQLYNQNIKLQNENDNLKHRLANATQVYHEQKSDGRETKQQKRERAFKFWLAGKSYQPHHQEQNKLHINDMNRVQVWDALQRIDSSLFNANKDDFFKNQALARFSD